MEKTLDLPNTSVGAAQERIDNENRELQLNLPSVKLWDDFFLYQYQGFWCPSLFIKGLISFQNHFQAQESDVILATYPKSGTTWLKALVFAIVNRSRNVSERNPVLTTFPHDLVRFLELDLYNKDQPPNLEDFPTPRIFATHSPYASLPQSIVKSNCRIVYMCRNTLDQFISEWEFFLGIQTSGGRSFEEAFEMTCRGVQVYGPIWEHVLGYWKASKEKPQKVLFLKFEDLIENITYSMKILADFLGCPFSNDEETHGVIEEISRLCKFDNLKNLEINKTGKFVTTAEKRSFFRKGEVGDWKNYLTPSMAERLEKLMEEKLQGSGLTFKNSLKVSK